MPLSPVGSRTRAEFRRKYGGQKKGDAVFYAKLRSDDAFAESMHLVGSDALVALKQKRREKGNG